uniref:NP1 n=1 Tax=Octopus kaurna TaxID=243731 RepID=B6Z1Y8_OCTKA|nr:NP1 [Octopus kaurna]
MKGTTCVVLLCLLVVFAGLCESEANPRRAKGCSYKPCKVIKCKKYPKANCKSNAAVNCRAYFFVEGRRVKC